MSVFYAMWRDGVAGMGGDEIQAALKGNIKNPPITNFCCVRVSHALLAAGKPITIASNYRDAEGNKYIIKVATMTKYLRDTFVAPVRVTKDSIGRKCGIIVFHQRFADATGHADLFNGRDGAGCKYNAYWDSCDYAELWEF